MTQTFYLPDLGEGLAEAEIVSWYVQEGSAIQEDDLLLSVETAKALVDVPSPYTGSLHKIHASPGEVIPVHAALAEFIVTQDEIVAQEAINTQAEVTKEKIKPAAANNASTVEIREDQATVVGKMNTTNQVSDDFFIVGKDRPQQAYKKPLASPATRVEQQPTSHTSSNHTAEQAKAVNLPMSTSVALCADDHYETELLRGSRRSMADAMQQSHEQVASVTLFDQADITHWYGNKDITSTVISAMCEAVKAEPRLNAWFDHEARQLHIHHHVNLGLAIDTADGLFVPVLQQINRTPQFKIRDTVNQVIQEVKNRQASPERFKRATITLSNFGSIAGRYATPMIVPPMVAIVGSGRLFDEPKFQASKKGKAKVKVHKMLPLSFTFDHRAATGGEGSRFLKAMIQFLENS